MSATRLPVAIFLAALGAALGGCGAAGRGSAVITVTPAVGLYDQPRSIVVSHLDPGELVTVTASSSRPSGVSSASATFRANAAGVVDLAHAPARSGSYRGVSPMGLFWSQRLASGPGAAVDFRTVTELAVSAGGSRLATARATQLLTGPGVSERAETLGSAGFVGAYFAPPGGARRPAVVTWGGSEGGYGAGVEWAALLASHGIPALAIAYFNEPGLPCSLRRIPLEYFIKAVRWLRFQPEVDPGRVWLLSGSRGSEPELLVAAHWPRLIHGLVAAAPSSIAYGAVPGGCPARGSAGAWTLRGRPVPYDPDFGAGAAAYSRSGAIIQAPGMEQGMDAPAARAGGIPARAIRAAVLLISGGQDEVWPSRAYADRIMASLHFDPARHEHLNYPAAGHFVLCVPYVPPVTESREFGFTFELGGTARADSAAYERDWPAMIRFIATA